MRLYAPAEVQAKAPRLLLHAAALQFTHPASGLALSFESSPGFLEPAAAQAVRALRR